MRPSSSATVLILFVAVSSLSCEPKPKPTPTELNAALLEAIMRGDEQRTIDLLREGADPNTKDEQGDSAIIKATGIAFLSPMDYPKPRIVIALADNGADLSATGASGRTPLGKLAGTCMYFDGAPHYEKTISVLISLNADINATDGSGNTPLMNASEQRCVEILKLLLAEGARHDLRNQNGETALMIAERWKSLDPEAAEEVRQVLRAAGAKE